MDALYERVYFVTVLGSHIVDENEFYLRLKAIVPDGTKIYGCWVPRVGQGETGVVNYYVVVAFPFVTWRERLRPEVSKWVSATSVGESLLAAFGERISVVVPHLVEDEVDEVDEESEESEESYARYTAGTDEFAYGDLATFLEDTQTYMEKDGLDKTFGDRIDPVELEADTRKVSVLGSTPVMVMC
jgi:hypothetical protein